MLLGSIALSDESVGTAARSAVVQLALAPGVGLVLLVELLLLPHAATSSAKAAITSSAATPSSARFFIFSPPLWRSSMIDPPPSWFVSLTLAPLTLCPCPFGEKGRGRWAYARGPTAPSTASRISPDRTSSVIALWSG